MKCVNMHVLNDLWAEIDEFGMNMRMKHDWVVGCLLA